MSKKLVFVCAVVFAGVVLPIGGLSPAAAPKRTHIVFVSGDYEYGSEETFPIICAELEK